MEVHRDITALTTIRNPVVTIGTFDGVHRGHKAILEQMRHIAGFNDGETVLLTFYPHPRMVLHPGDHGLRLLSTMEEKEELLSMAGVDHLVVYPFSEEFSRKTAFEYVRDMLVDQLHVHTLVVGYDHRFGRNREGDFLVLKELSQDFGFHLVEIAAQKLKDVKVSSTKIRTALEVGNIDQANESLGYDYEIHGTVVKGEGRGRQIGFPTANIGNIEPDKLLPAKGVYSVMVRIDEEKKRGVLNIGVRPTVSGSGNMSVEVHIPGFERDVYGKNITVGFLKRIRDEKKFGSVIELSEQIKEDIKLSLL
ncbi:MAG: bifunctional riboflavin kinase/FAD synthetase [Flavobacteriales bacterium]|nr:bifunctional riboflavin kinase/FAD synthetase [Flavobacteriales bacterium]